MSPYPSPVYPCLLVRINAYYISLFHLGVIMHFIRALAGFPILFFAVQYACGQTTRASTQPTTMPIRLMGTVASVDGNALVVAPRPAPGNVHRDQVTVTLGDNDIIKVDGEISKASALGAGMNVTVQSVPGNARHPARLYVIANSPGLYGVVARVDGTNIVVNPSGAKSEISVVTDDKTKVSFLGAVIHGRNVKPVASAVSDLKPGMRVEIIPATGTAKEVLVMPDFNGGSPASRPSE